MSYLWATRFWSSTTLLFLSNVQSLIVQHGDEISLSCLYFHLHMLMKYLHILPADSRKKIFFWCMQDVPPSSLQAKKFYEFWVYMVKGDHNTSYYYFFLTQMPKYHKVSFLSSACSILYQNSFPLMETTPISLWVHLHCTTLHWTRKVWWSASNLRQSL